MKRSGIEQAHADFYAVLRPCLQRLVHQPDAAISIQPVLELEPFPLALAHGVGSNSLFSRASSPVRVFRRERDLLYLPAYSPDLSPIEPAWAKMKAHLRRIAARTVETLQQAIAPALDSITAQDARSFFRHCGYACPN